MTTENAWRELSGREQNEKDFVQCVLDYIYHHHHIVEHYLRNARFNNCYDKSNEDILADLDRYGSIFKTLYEGHYPLGYLAACRIYLKELVDKFGDYGFSSQRMVERFDEVFYE